MCCRGKAAASYRVSCTVGSRDGFKCPLVITQVSDSVLALDVTIVNMAIIDALIGRAPQSPDGCSLTTFVLVAFSGQQRTLRIIERVCAAMRCKAVRQGGTAAQAGRHARLPAQGHSFIPVVSH